MVSLCMSHWSQVSGSGHDWPCQAMTGHVRPSLTVAMEE